MWPEAIFIQGVFKDLCSCDFLFLFSVVLFFEILSSEEKTNKQGNKYLFLVIFRNSFLNSRKKTFLKEKKSVFLKYEIRPYVPDPYPLGIPPQTLVN